MIKTTGQERQDEQASPAAPVPSFVKDVRLSRTMMEWAAHWHNDFTPLRNSLNECLMKNNGENE